MGLEEILAGLGSSGLDSQSLSSTETKKSILFHLNFECQHLVNVANNACLLPRRFDIANQRLQLGNLKQTRIADKFLLKLWVKEADDIVTISQKLLL